jgi:hypothetical protein
MKIKQQKLITEFAKHLGERFPVIEVASEGAPITIVAKDAEGKEYWLYLEDKLKKSIEPYTTTGIKIENTHFYNLYALMSQGSNVFWMSLFEDGYILFYLNDCLTPEQLKVTETHTLIGVASSLHIERNKPEPTKILGSLDLK